MKAVLYASLCLVLLACQGNTQEKVQIKTGVDSVSYGIGMDIGKTLKMQDIAINPDVLARGLKDASDSAHALMSEKATQEVMNHFRQDMAMKQQEKMKAMSDKGKIEGEAFLASNKTKEGVKTTASGLQYKILKAGSGPKPGPSQSVTVHYRGTILDGTEFDNTYTRNEPYTLTVDRFVKGFGEGLQLMNVGSKYQLFIPGELAYGPHPPQGTPITPNAVLLFDVELVSINK